MTLNRPRIKVSGLTKIFADKADAALSLLKAGQSRAEIQKATGAVVGLQDVSFDIAEGEILVVMGLSGSGKSTCLRCINRLIEPTAGSVFVDDVDVTKLSERELMEFRRTRFGMVFQQFALFPHRTIVKNVEYGLEIQGVPAAARHERAMTALETVGLKGWDQHYPSQLSGGMQQRAGLARALALDPDVLLMDEAFSALDPLIRRDMQQELVALQKRLKKTIVFVSHDLDEAIALGGRIVLMKDGRVVQQGTAADFLANPADDYVRRFVEHIDVLGVVTAGDAMRAPAAVKPWHATAAEALASLTQSGEPVMTVVCQDGRFQGTVDADTLKAAGDTELRLLLSDTQACVPTSATLNETVAKLATGRGEIAVIDADRSLRGVIANADLVATLARRHSQPVH
ncbi:quaternary amine ABC transporter ATP-binding protein [Ancylobacter defluvii]|uniref:Quaternary amine transport ATP-binding protein n=1 Tax=Ancylobacter defluvii TaxID=1282440 RepID=A0A9W6ND59_9HYPH|nr:glycine betaine/L-proline ABC transporter ATP-binding protein [Ancylobacter defluvii]MBS7586941.1 glycine betaine/L-proline ABC transporter ATP-binding protein [Ancylobacter defluvii]GLK86246.1 glycine/betaine ABC transporter ATP-binding protein [Ancylobacter defluvii]